MFSFFSELKTIGSDQLNKKCEHLANVYHKDLNYGDHLNECEHLKHLIKCSTQTFAKFICRELLHKCLEVNGIQDVIFHTHE
jgi:hypothetical protein